MLHLLCVLFSLLLLVSFSVAYTDVWHIVPCGYNQPHGLVIDALDNLYILDSEHGRLVKVANNGTELAIFSTSDPYLWQTYGVALDSAGYIYLGDNLRSRVVKLAPNGTQVFVFTPTLSNAFYSIAVDSSYNLFISDSQNNRVLKLSPTGQQLAILPQGTTPPQVTYGQNIYQQIIYMTVKLQ